ncbi:hypothetical protein DYB26_015587 [Aphanomyces astaci]|uniref:HTH CENPB-type domain-containing protein n=1 Tax=Aphanomyces astaci TaxID=112090 RepID=A0A397FFX6_APHAT|nr:hypothetical protein DYB36_007573 [Aphanomyces astaci]RHZ18258.1 hypothetical protein DYB26_015587 [Aphanomyces astaci]RHZ23231.1 hypothetical protein DYB31_005459 [Aphanomyces astaci]
MGRRPMLPPLYEADLVTWILAMERDGHPVNRSQIQDKAAEMFNVIHGFTRPAKPTSGYQKFLARNEALKTKKSNLLSKPRHAVDKDAVVHFFDELGKALSLVNMAPKRPLFVLPADRVSTEVCDNLVIPGAAVTTSEKGWTNSFICRKWLSMLSSAIPTSTARPILLIVDGCSSHYSNYIYDEAQRLEILLLFLPANSAQMFQPLDVTVFRPFKQAIRWDIANNKWNDVASSISKQEAIAIACRVWTLTTKESSITNGFDCTGLCPPSLDMMLYRLSIFKLPQDASVAIDDTWLKRCAVVRSELLVLPPPKKKRVARKTLTVSGKFITADYHDILQSQAAARPKARKKSQSATSTPADQDYDVVVSEEEMELVEL